MAEDTTISGEVEKTLNKYIFVVFSRPPMQLEAVAHERFESLRVSTEVDDVQILRHPHCHLDMSKKIHTVYLIRHALCKKLEKNFDMP